MLVIWGTAAAAFLALFFLGGSGPVAFAGDSWRIALSAAVVAAGFIVHFTMLARTRAKAGGIERDERDEIIELRGSRIALVVVLVYVFGLAISLWLAFQGDRLVPAGWMWFMAYSTAFCGYLAQAAAMIVLDAALGGGGAAS